MNEVRVIIVDDDPMVRAGLTMMLGGAATVDVVGEASDGDEVPEAVRLYRPDVVLMDIRMARVDGITATKELRGWDDAPQVLVLTTFDADQQVLGAIRAGAAGFLLKDTPPADIVRAIHSVAAGDAMFSPAVARQLIGLIGAAPRTAERDAARERLAVLSEREREVAHAIGKGLANADIGVEVYMSTATVKAYVSRLLTKLDLSNRVQVALLVQEADLPTGTP